MTPIFITGTGTGIGKTLVAAIVVAALDADYWKPVQAGFEDGTDTSFVKHYAGGSGTYHPESYRLQLPASPHIAAREEGIRIDLSKVWSDYQSIITQSRNRFLVIEGAGGISVPLNEDEFVIDLIKKLSARVLLVSRNYLGSINHSLLTAAACRSNGIDVAGWIFNDQFMQYEKEIEKWTGYPIIASIPALASISVTSIQQQAMLIGNHLLNHLQHDKS